MRFHWHTSFEALSPARDGLQLSVRSATGPETHHVGCVVACDGGRSRVAEALKLRRVRADGKEEPPTEELAVVVNLENQKEQEDRLLEECPRGLDSELPLVKRLIYLQGETHYFIMTVEPEVLVEHQVLRSGQEP